MDLILISIWLDILLIYPETILTLRYARRFMIPIKRFFMHPNAPKSTMFFHIILTLSVLYGLISYGQFKLKRSNHYTDLTFKF